LASPPAPSSDRSGVVFILGATAVAGVAGYIVQGVAPLLLHGAENYLRFQTFWSTLYLAVAALSGIQQEVTRATHRRAPNSPRAPRTFAQPFAAAVSAATLLIVLSTAALWAPALFPVSTVPLVLALAAATTGYAGAAVLSGLLYGLRLWRAVALLTSADAILRLVLIIVVGAIAPTLSALGWAVAVPFTLALAVVWMSHRQRVVDNYEFDVPLRRLAQNSGKTLLGAVSIGVLTSGLPMLIDVTSRSEDAATVGALTFVITLTRAPVVIVVLALQSYLTVRFRDRAARASRELLSLLGGLAAATVAIALAAFVLEPPVLEAIWGPEYRVDGATCALVVLSAGMTGALGITGSAVLARADHRSYMWGWVGAAVLLVVLMLTPMDVTPRVLMATAVAPVLGLLIHLHSVYVGGFREAWSR